MKFNKRTIDQTSNEVKEYRRHNLIKFPFEIIPFKPIKINNRVAMISIIFCDFSKDKILY